MVIIGNCIQTTESSKMTLLVGPPHVQLTLGPAYDAPVFCQGWSHQILAHAELVSIAHYIDRHFQVESLLRSTCLVVWYTPKAANAELSRYASILTVWQVEDCRLAGDIWMLCG